MEKRSFHMALFFLVGQEFKDWDLKSWIKSSWDISKSWCPDIALHSQNRNAGYTTSLAILLIRVFLLFTIWIWVGLPEQLSCFPSFALRNSPMELSKPITTMPSIASIPPCLQYLKGIYKHQILILCLTNIKWDMGGWDDNLYICQWVEFLVLIDSDFLSARENPHLGFQVQMTITPFPQESQSSSLATSCKVTWPVRRCSHHGLASLITSRSKYPECYFGCCFRAHQLSTLAELRQFWRGFLPACGASFHSRLSQLKDKVWFLLWALLSQLPLDYKCIQGLIDPGRMLLVLECFSCHYVKDWGGSKWQGSHRPQRCSLKRQQRPDSQQSLFAQGPQRIPSHLLTPRQMTQLRMQAIRKPAGLMWKFKWEKWREAC